jgi:hypothetical protein
MSAMGRDCDIGAAKNHALEPIDWTFEELLTCVRSIAQGQD